MTLHEIPMERRTLHGHFSRDLEPILSIEPGDSIAFSCLDAGWNVEPGAKYEPRDPELDAGHALIGPIEVRGARAGQTLEVAVDRVVVGDWGWCAAADWSTPLNDRLGLSAGPGVFLEWALDPDAGIGRDERGHELDLRPFLGVLGMPPPDSGVHSTTPPRRWGGNIDCKELRAGARLYLPIPVDGALFSAGDGHARQGDGEVSQIAIECPLARAELTLALRDDLELVAPVAWTPDAWLTFGFDEDLDEAAAAAIDAMLELIGREHGLERAEALALASLVVDLRVTQMVNEVQGVHAVLAHDAIRFTRMA
ncbi:MAG TPA: acetamidase/formamidase family protein [Gaiellaceae bacterium]|nr:acetamidase/formamidase family protein [Gaiellaceae bacterium]